MKKESEKKTNVTSIRLSKEQHQRLQENGVKNARKRLRANTFLTNGLLHRGD